MLDNLLSFFFETGLSISSKLSLIRQFKHGSDMKAFLKSRLSPGQMECRRLSLIIVSEYYVSLFDIGFGLCLLLYFGKNNPKPLNFYAFQNTFWIVSLPHNF